MKKNLYEMSTIEIYAEVLEQKDVKKFPSNFWRGEGKHQRAAECTRYMIENVLGWTINDVIEKLTHNTFKENKLYGMLNYVYDCCPYAAISDVYNMKPWEVRNVPNRYWLDKNNVINAMRWMFEEKLEWSIEDIKNKVSIYTFKDYNLLPMLNTVYNGSPYAAINDLYPNQIQPWELNNVPFKYWIKEDNRARAIKWVLDKNNISLKDIKFEHISNNNLKGLLALHYGNSITRLKRELKDHKMFN